jgi:hypothetical protein
MKIVGCDLHARQQTIAVLDTLFPPRRDFSPCIEQVLKPAQRQTLQQLSVKALDVCILRRLSWLNVHQLDLPLHTPGQEVTTRQFRSVVTADRLRLSPLGHDRVQLPSGAATPAIADTRSAASQSSCHVGWYACETSRGRSATCHILACLHGLFADAFTVKRSVL